MDNEPIPIFTVGYGRRTIDELLAVLQQNEIRYLIDVRTAPYSRYRPDFSKAALERALPPAGIRYVFMGQELGGRPDDPTCYQNGKVDYEAVKQRDFYRQGIERLQKAFAQKQRIILMCSESQPENCHRSLLIGASLTELGIPVLHIDENDEPQSQTTIINRRTGGQLSLFGEPTFTSRKRYEERTVET